MSDTEKSPIDNDKLFEIEAAEYKSFKALYHGGTYKYLRYGQAFYNHFGMHKTTKRQDLLGKLYEMNEDDAIEFIRKHFIIK